VVAIGALFQGADLSHSRLTGAAAAQADFSNARLRRTQLNGADLQEATFAGADTRGTDFSNARFDTTVNFDNVLNSPALRDQAPEAPGH